MSKSLKELSYFTKFSADSKSIYLLVSIWLLMVIMVNPIGNFPLDDDWAYGWTVKTLLETGSFQLSDWTATNLLPQALWGSLFCLPFGFSFTALRFSTLVLGLLGIIATYGLLREISVSSRISLLATLVVALNPIYFGLSNSFTSDVPSFTLCILSICFLVRGTRLNSKAWIIAGLTLTFISILNRQSSLIILPAFGISYLIRHKFTLKNLLKAFLPSLGGVIIYSTYSHWLDTTGRTPLLYGLQIGKLIETLSGGPKTIGLTYIENVWIISIYLGMFLFPFLVLQLPLLFKTFSIRQRRWSLYTTLLIMAIGIFLILKGIQMPLTRNTLFDLGVGPHSLEGYNSFLRDSRPARILIRGFWALLTLMGLVGAAILFLYAWIAAQALIKQRYNLRQAWLIVFLLACSLLYFLPIGGIDKKYWFDRYLILLLPLVVASILFVTKRCLVGEDDLKPRVVAFCGLMLFCLGTFTVSATHDFLLWNRVRWLALNNLMHYSQIPPNQIGGGMEFNGWYFGNRIETCNPDFQLSNTSKAAGWGDFSCLWNNSDREYTVAFIPRPGYEQQAVYPFRRWLPWREEVLYVLHKLENNSR